MFFSQRRPNPARHGEWPSTICLPEGDHSTHYTVEASNHIRYLGFHFDHRLAWDKHIATVSSRAKSTLKALQLLGNSMRGLDHASWHLAYNAICVPVLMYGALVWFHNQKRHIKTLQGVQNVAIGIITGAFQSTPREPLHQLIAILPIHIRLKKIVM
jgi:hypothetical protein